jgi:hypothetical protein
MAERFRFDFVGDSGVVREKEESRAWLGDAGRSLGTAGIEPAREFRASKRGRH